MAIDEDDVLTPDAARAAADAIADLAKQHFLPHLHPESPGKLFELVEKGLVPPAHQGRS